MLVLAKISLMIFVAIFLAILGLANLIFGLYLLFSSKPFREITTDLARVVVLGFFWTTLGKVLGGSTQEYEISGKKKFLLAILSLLVSSLLFYGAYLSYVASTAVF